MKTKLFTLPFAALMLIVFCSCPGSPEPPPPPPAEKENNQSSGEAGTSLKTIYGKVHDTQGNVLNGVEIRQQSGGKQVTKSDGIFQLDINVNNNDSKTVNFIKSNKETLRLRFDEIEYLESIDIFMEDKIVHADSVILLGTTSVKTAGGSSPLEDVKVYETKNRNTVIQTDDYGKYQLGLNHNLNNETIIYGFKYQGNNVSVEIKNLLDIKDSTKMDVVLVTGSEPYPWKVEDN